MRLLGMLDMLDTRSCRLGLWSFERVRAGWGNRAVGGCEGRRAENRRHYSHGTEQHGARACDWHRRGRLGVQHPDADRYSDDQVKRIVREVGIPNPFELSTFLARLEQWRRRPIKLSAYDHMPRGMCGMWLVFPTFDVIGYARATPLHEEHIIFHEVGHMLCDHQGTNDKGSELRNLLPNLDPRLIERVLARTSYSDFEERQAELFATKLAMIAKRTPDGRARTHPSPSPELDRLFSTFEE
jgi:hypothetical protein